MMDHFYNHLQLFYQLTLITYAFFPYKLEQKFSFLGSNHYLLGQHNWMEVLQNMLEKRLWKIWNVRCSFRTQHR